MSRVVQDACVFCGATQKPLQQCSRCKQVRYCSEACQRAHWPRHSRFCRPAAPLAPSAVPAVTVSPVARSQDAGAAPLDVAAAAASPWPTFSSPHDRESAIAAARRLAAEAAESAMTGTAAAAAAAAATAAAAAAAAASSGTPLSRAPIQKAKPAITRADLPPEFSVFEYIPSRDSVDENLMIFFHGLGDSLKRWRTLAETMNLPQTCSLCLQAPTALPLGMGHSWYTTLDLGRDDDDLTIKPTPDEVRRVRSLQQLRGQLRALLQRLEAKGWPLGRVHLFGFAQGGDVALDLALAVAAAGQSLGSVVAVSGTLLREFMQGWAVDPVYAVPPAGTAPSPLSPAATAAGGGAGDAAAAAAAAVPAPVLFLSSPTRPDDAAAAMDASSPPRAPPAAPPVRAAPLCPVLLTVGAQDRPSVLADADETVRFLQRRYPGALVQKRVFARGHEMIRSEEEARAVFEFLASALSRRMVALEQMSDVVELTRPAPFQ